MRCLYTTLQAQAVHQGWYVAVEVLFWWFVDRLVPRLIACTAFATARALPLPLLKLYVNSRIRPHNVMCHVSRVSCHVRV
jgi:hypothetical protein